MGALTRVYSASPEDPATALTGRVLSKLGMGKMSAAGKAVSSDSAMRVSTVLRCLTLIVDAIASLPLSVHRKTADGSEPASEHMYHDLLHAQPNRRHTSRTFRQLLVAPILMEGNGYAIMDRRRGRVTEMAPCPMRHVNSVVVKERGGRLKYDFPFWNLTDVDQVDVIHVPGMGFDGLKGMSVIRAGADSVGLAMSLEEYASKISATSSLARGVVEVPGSLMGESETLANLGASLDALFRGDGYAVPLDAGMTWKSLTINPVDAEILAQRRFQVEDICRLFGVWPWMVGETTKNTSWGSGIEHQNMAFVTYVLRSWLVAIEQELNRKLFFGTPYFCEFNVNGLLRGDAKTRAEFYHYAIRDAWMRPNEARRKENLPPDPAGDDLLVDQTLIPLRLIGDQQGRPTAGKDSP